MSQLSFVVQGWSAWSPDRTTPSAWLAWAGGESGPDIQVTAPPLPQLLKRRITPVGQRALAAAYGLPGIEQTHFVLASQHGELARTAAIFAALADGEPLSPAEFSLSVDHALVGLLSIATHNRHGHTAIAAGTDSFACGLLEATSLLGECPDIPVMLLYYDAQLPPEYACFDTEPTATFPLVVALLLTAPLHLNPAPIIMEIEPVVEPNEEAPQQAALVFLRFLLGQQLVARAIGHRMSWRWRKG